MECLAYGYAMIVNVIVFVDVSAQRRKFVNQAHSIKCITRRIFYKNFLTVI